MKKRLRGVCPPLLAIGLAFLLITVTSCMAVAKAADSVIPGSEVAPPGGTTTVSDPSVGDPPDGAEVEPPSEGEDSGEVAVVIDPTQDPNYLLWLQQQQQAQEQEQGEGEEGQENPTEGETGDPIPEITQDPVGQYPSQLDTSGVNIVSPSLDSLLAEGADLEALLYPSGLKLPTKYMDLLMFASITYSTPITSETAYFLKTAAPVEGGTYTYAEYRAAEVYLAMCRMNLAESNMTNTAASVRSLDTNTTVNWTMNVTNATLTNSTRMVALISNYKSILESFAEGGSISGHRQYSDFVADHKGIRYSCGNLDDLISLANGGELRDADLSNYVLSLYSWWDYAGIVHNFTSAVVDYSAYYNELSYNNINFTRGAPAVPVHSGTGTGSGGGIAAGDNPTQQTGGETTVFGEGLTGQGNNTTVSGSSSDSVSGGGYTSDTPVASVGNTPGPDTSVLPSGVRDVQEVGSIVAAVFVVVAVIGLWIIHLSRKGGRLF